MPDAVKLEPCSICGHIVEEHEGLAACTNDPDCPLGCAMYPLAEWIAMNERIKRLIATRTPSTTASTEGEGGIAKRMADELARLMATAIDPQDFHEINLLLDEYRANQAALKLAPATPTPSASTEGAKCQYDTDGDGNCGKPLCPVCHPENRLPASPQGADRGAQD